MSSEARNTNCNFHFTSCACNLLTNVVSQRNCFYFAILLAMLPSKDVLLQQYLKEAHDLSMHQKSGINTETLFAILVQVGAI